MWPDFFYFTTSQNREQYSSLPPGQLNVERLINQEPCFIQYSESPQSKKSKTLIITDWTAPRWETFQIESIQQCLSQLLADGFSVYIWEGDHLEKLAHDQLHALYDPAFQQNIKFATLEEIISKTGNKQLTQENVFILDDYW